MSSNHANDEALMVAWRYKIATGVLAVLAIGMALALALDPGKDYRGKSLVNLNYLDPELNYYPKEDLLVNIQPLRERLLEIEDQYDDRLEISMYFEVMSTGANISVNQDLRVFPVSLAKLPLSMVIYKKIDNKTLDKDHPITVQEADVNSASGILHNDGLGQTFTVMELVKVMLIESDNTAYNALRRQVTDDELDEFRNSVGLEDLFRPGGQVSAKEYSRLFRSLYSSSYLSVKSSSELLQCLADSEFNEFLKSGLPDGVIFAHKWGGDYMSEIYADSGIIYFQNRPVILTVMARGPGGSKELSRRHNAEVMAQVSSAVNDFINR